MLGSFFYARILVMKYALISGGNSGLAKATTKLLIENDYIVFSLEVS